MRLVQWAVAFCWLGGCIAQAAPPALLYAQPSMIPKGRDATLTITGTNFSAPATLLWLGSRIPATVDSPTQIRVTVPAALVIGPTDVVIELEIAGQTASGPRISVTDGETAFITNLQPRSVLAGGSTFTLTLEGTGFQPSTQVTWEHTTQLSVSYVSPTRLTVQIPPGLTATNGFFVISAWSRGGEYSEYMFYVEPNPTPSIIAITPNQAAAGSAALRLQLVGMDFLDQKAQVLWNGRPLTTQNAGAGYLFANVPAALLAAPGSASVTVTQNGKTSNAVTFLITGQSRFSLTSLEPDAIDAGSPAFTLTVRGEGFDGQSMVNWNGNHLPSRLVSANTLTATIPAAFLEKAGPVPVMVTNTTRSTNPLTFTVRGSTTPTATTLTPASATAGSGTLTLSVTGSGWWSST